ncbi:MAG: thiolase family protein [Chloroflexi bacterium]|nr:MAG: thiolase family protein [Chloroflexota bacterium]
MREAVIVEAVRTPVGKFRGSLSALEPISLAALVLRAVVERARIDPAQVDDVIMGCVTQTGEQGANIGRLAALYAGFPVDVPAVSINRMCGSSQQAIHFASQSIVAGDADVVIAAGVESMSRVAMGSDYPPQFPSNPPYPLLHQGESAELICQKWGFSREALDEYSYQSHLKAAAATKSGHFQREILPVVVGQNGDSRVLDYDEGIRFEPNLARMAALKPAFREDGVITAGNASQISDGAAAVLVMERGKAEALGLKPRARFVSRVAVGSDPELMLTGPIAATEKALKRAGLSIGQMDVIEINEAFAAVVLAWAAEIEPPMERVNPNGGAVALGHPLGATGAKLMTTLLHELERSGGRYGLQTMCIGHGQATATIIERL